MIAYIETSAAAKILFLEPETDRLKAHLDELAAAGAALISSAILETELRRAAVREGAPQQAVTAILDRFDVYDLERSVFTEAGVLPGINLRSHDALHVASALRLNAHVMISYDQRQIDAAESVGLRVMAP